MVRRLPPGPGSGLLRMGLGNIRRMRHDLLQFMVELASEYGDAVYFRTGPYGVFQFTHPDHLHDILVTRAKSFHRPHRVRRTLSKWNGNGLLLSEGSTWARQRRMVQPAFHPNRVKAYGEISVAHAQAILAAHGAGTPVDIATELSRCTLGVICEALFGAEVSDIADQFTHHVAALQEVAIHEMMAPVVLPDWVPTPRKRRLRAAIEFLDDTVLGIISQRRESEEDRGDLLSMLLLAVDQEGDGGRMTDRQIRDQAVTLMLGGNETTATALTWAVYLLASNPDEQLAVHEELDAVLGDGPAASEHFPRLPKTEAAWKESLRLYPPVYATSRVAIENLSIGGYDLRRGDQIQLVPYVTHRSEQWFDNPAEFQPARFYAEAPPARHPLAYHPFGAGPRACIGKGLAMLEGVLVLATLLREHRVELAEPGHVPTPEAQISLHPRGGLHVRLIPRKLSDTRRASLDRTRRASSTA